MKVFKRFIKGLLLKGEASDPSDNLEGSMWHNSSDNELRSYLGAAIRTLVSTDQAQTLTNKVIDADNNTISNLVHGAEVDNPSSGVHGVVGTVVGTSDVQSLTNKKLGDGSVSFVADGDNTKALDVLLGGATASTTMTLQSSQTANRTLLLPNATDTLVARNTLDVMTNKSFGDSGDSSKIAKFDTSGATTSTDMTIVASQTASRSITLPDATDTLVGKATTDILTNKTIDGDDNTVQDLPETAIKTNITNASKFFTRDASGIPESASKAVPTGDVVGSSDAQTLTTKTIDADNNTITNLAHGAEVDNPSSGVHGVTGSVVGTSDAQVLTGKDIDGGTASNTSRLTVPKASKATLDGLTRKEGTIVYASDVNTLYADDGTDLQQIGSGGGGGTGVNYLTGDNSTFATSIGDWVEYANTTPSADPEDGDGGTASNIIIGHNTGEGPRGNGWLSLTVLAANAQGEGISVDYKMHNIDEDGKQIWVSFDYSYAGTSVADGDFAVFVYDVTNATLLGRLINDDSGDLLTSTSANIYKSFRGWFSSSSATAGSSYRLIIHRTVATAASQGLRIDNVVIGPQAFVETAIMRDPVAFTPTGSWSGAVSYNGHYSRFGKWMQLSMTVTTSSAPTGGTLIFNMPTGFTIDTDALNNVDGDHALPGVVHCLDSGLAAYDGFVVYETTTSIQPTVQNAAGTYSTTSGINASVPFAFGNLDRVQVEVMVPIAEWSSGALLSATENSNVVAAMSRKAGASQSIPSGPFTPIDFETSTISSGDLTYTSGVTYTAATGTWATNPEVNINTSGIYSISAQILMNNALWSTNKAQTLSAYVNGVNVGFFEQFPGVQDTACSHPVGGSLLLDLSKGDTLQIRYQQNHGAAIIMASNPAFNHFSIHRIPNIKQWGTYGEFELLSAESSTKTPAATSHYHQLTGNSLTLTPGTWELKPSFIRFTASGTPAYSYFLFAWFAANGADSATIPAALSTAAGLTILSPTNATFAGMGEYIYTANSAAFTTHSVLVRVTQTVTIYLVSFANMTTASSARIAVYPQAERKQ